MDEMINTLNNLYGLLMEINYNRDLEGEISNEDEFVSRHIKKISLHRTKAKAVVQKSKFEKARIEFFRLKKIGFDKIKELLPENERMELVPLFSKFEDIGEEDKVKIKEDEEFLYFISSLKDKLDNSNRGESTN
ncbi:MAG: hypothetical protein AAGB24_06125 [Bacteroidota bacterium]